MGRMRRTIKIDWTFDPANPQNPTPVTRPDGSPLHSYWSDPNGMIYQYLDRPKADQTSKSHGAADNVHRTIDACTLVLDNGKTNQHGRKDLQVVSIRDYERFSFYLYS